MRLEVILSSNLTAVTGATCHANTQPRGYRTEIGLLSAAGDMGILIDFGDNEPGSVLQRQASYHYFSYFYNFLFLFQVRKIETGKPTKITTMSKASDHCGNPSASNVTSPT
jgi:hypothetical protein